MNPSGETILVTQEQDRNQSESGKKMEAKISEPPNECGKRIERKKCVAAKISSLPISGCHTLACISAFAPSLAVRTLLLAFFAAGVLSTRALTIIATFDTTITSDVNATTIENTINSAIQLYEARFSDPVTVTIQFKEITTSGLYGSSSWWYYNLSYSSFRSALASHAHTANDAIAMSLLPASSVNPVSSTTTIRVKTANIHALGFTGMNSGLSGGYDGVIGLHTSQLNLSRASTVATKGDLLSTVCHEIDEVLGMSSGLDSGSPDPLPQDLFRYSSTGARSYTASGDDAYFSIDGTTLLVRCNQSSGEDYGDWWVAGGHTARVQDASATNGKTPNPNVELIAVDVIGYTLVPIPAPVITNITVAGSQVTLAGTNGIAANNYIVLASTNMATPLSQWLPLSTNFLNNTGPFTFVIPNAAGPSRPQRFFALQVQ
jgi:hypothetical protein